MKVFVTGASGHIGGAVVTELLAHGHAVAGLARSDASAAAVQAAGAEVVRGDLTDPDGLATAARAANGVIHLGYNHDWMRGGDGDFLSAVAQDLAATTAIGEALAGTDKPLVTTSGSMMLAMGGITDRPGTEDDAFPSGPRIDAENHVIGLAERGVRSSVIRLAPSVHSDLDHHGFVPTLIGMAREQGAAAYVGDGANRWPGVNTRDAATLYRLALESAPAGTRLHGVEDEGVPFREIAEAIGAGLGVPAESVTPDQAETRFGVLAAFVQMDGPASNAKTRAVLGWSPEHPTLLEDLAPGGTYFTTTS